MLESGPVEEPGANPRGIARKLQEARLARGGTDPNVLERSFDRGASGEERVGRELNAQWELWGGFGVLHSIVRPEGGDIDHIVVGPAGVTIIDTKNWSGEAWVGRTAVGRGRYGRRRCVDGVRSQV